MRKLCCGTKPWRQGRSGVQDPFLDPVWEIMLRYVQQVWKLRPEREDLLKGTELIQPQHLRSEHPGYAHSHNNSR